MQNARFLLYMLTVGMVFLGLSAIKMILPHEEPKEPIDEIGMRLYRPIFFGNTAEGVEPAKEKTQEVAFQDNMTEEVEEAKPEKAASKKTEKIVTEKVEEVVKPKASKPKGSSTNLDDSEFFEEMIREYKETTLKQRKYRNDVVVRYYRHQPDGDRAKVLVDYGFYLHERPVSDQSEYQNTMCNVIYYGKEFPERDLKLITYLLIKNGIEIKELRRFKDFDGWKRKSIEIGSSYSLKNKPVLNLKELRALSSPD